MDQDSASKIEKSQETIHTIYSGSENVSMSTFKGSSLSRLILLLYLQKDLIRGSLGVALIGDRMRESRLR